jgi:hypothetical protein
VAQGLLAAQGLLEVLDSLAVVGIKVLEDLPAVWDSLAAKVTWDILAAKVQMDRLVSEATLVVLVIQEVEVTWGILAAKEHKEMMVCEGMLAAEVSLAALDTAVVLDSQEVEQQGLGAAKDSQEA